MNLFKVVLVGLGIISVTGCYPSGNVLGNSQRENFVSNPASALCVNDGGYVTLDLDENSHDKVGMCHFTNGQVIEQWTYYNAAKANAEELYIDESQK